MRRLLEFERSHFKTLLNAYSSELSTWRDSTEKLASRLTVMDNDSFGEASALRNELDQWKSLHGELEALLQALTLQHSTLQISSAKEIADLRIVSEKAEAQARSCSQDMVDVCRALSLLAHEMDVQFSALNLSTFRIKGICGPTDVTSRFEMFFQNGTKAIRVEAERQLTKLSEFMRMLFREIIQPCLQREAEYFATFKRSMNLILGLGFLDASSPKSASLGDATDSNLFDPHRFHALLEQLIEYVRRLEASIESERRTTASRHNIDFRANQLRLEQIEEECALEVREAQRASEEALHALHVAQMEVDNSARAESAADSRRSRFLGSGWVDPWNEWDEFPAAHLQALLCLEHTAQELSDQREKFDTLAAAYKCLSQLSDRHLETEQLIHAMAARCRNLSEDSFSVRDKVTLERDAMTRRGRSRGLFRAAVIAVLALNRMRNLMQERQKRWRQPSLFEEEFDEAGPLGSRLALPSLEDCRVLQHAEVANRVLLALTAVKYLPSSDYRVLSTE